MKKRWKSGISLLLILLHIVAVPASAIQANYRDNLYTPAGVGDAVPCLAGSEDEVRVSSRLWELFFGRRDARADMLCPGGGIIGLKLSGCGVTVEDVAREGGGLMAGDRILSIDGMQVLQADEVRRIVRESGGRKLKVQICRGTGTFYTELTPQRVGGAYQLGVLLSDGAAGIGTVTFIDPKTGIFGGLGHGICDATTGDIIPMTSGVVTGVILGGVERGEAGKPGELRGVLNGKAVGILEKNTECGVFGVLETKAESTAPIPIGKRQDLHEGAATIRSTVRGGETAEYAVLISDIDYASDGTKSFRIKVVDDDLIAMTGGIVRGMSGSPVIQDGKLVGAVTHVMIGDPTAGYGIFLENMLAAAEVVKKAA